MFKINTVQITHTGEILKPYTVQGDMVYCFDKFGKSVIRNVSEFNFKKTEEKKVISVIPKLVKPVIEIQPKENPVVETKAEIKTEVKTEPIVEIKQEVKIEPMAKVKSEVKETLSSSQDNTIKKNPSSIWDSIKNGEYI